MRKVSELRLLFPGLVVSLRWKQITGSEEKRNQKDYSIGMTELQEKLKFLRKYSLANH